MTKGQTITLIVVALLIFGGILYLASEQPGTITNTNETNESVPESETNEPVGEETAPGTSLVNEEGQVVNEEGETTRNDAEINDSDAPQQSDPIENEEDIPEDSVQIDVSSTGYSPSEFSVDSGSAVTLTITATDDQTHIFKFKDESMQGVAVGVGPGETRSISFNAPSSGEYDYFCDVPGHEGRGETGTMTVN